MTKLFLTCTEVYQVDIKASITGSDGLELGSKTLTFYLKRVKYAFVVNIKKTIYLKFQSPSKAPSFGHKRREELANVNFDFENFELSFLKRKPINFWYLTTALTCIASV